MRSKHCRENPGHTILIKDCDEAMKWQAALLAYEMSHCVLLSPFSIHWAICFSPLLNLGLKDSWACKVDTQLGKIIFCIPEH